MTTILSTIGKSYRPLPFEFQMCLVFQLSLHWARGITLNFYRTVRDVWFLGIKISNKSWILFTVLLLEVCWVTLSFIWSLTLSQLLKVAAMDIHIHTDTRTEKEEVVSTVEFRNPNSENQTPFEIRTFWQFGFRMAKNKMVTILFKTAAILFGLKTTKANWRSYFEWSERQSECHRPSENRTCSVFEPRL